MFLPDLFFCERAVSRGALRLLVACLLLVLAGSRLVCSGAEIPILFTVGDRTDAVFAEWYTGYRSTPYKVGEGVTSVAAGHAFLTFIKDDRSLWTCGRNDAGQLGDGSLLHRATPVQVAADVTAASGGFRHLVFLKSDGTVWTVGANESGQLGDGTTTSRATPQQIATGAVAVAAGTSHTLILKGDGTLWGCGLGVSGQLGRGSTANESTPVQIASQVVSITAGQDTSLWVDTEGALWATGRNTYGELGDGTVISRTTPVKVIASGVRQVSAGNGHSLVVKQDDTLWSAGFNLFGQLGDGTMTQRLVHVPVASGVSTASASMLFSMFRRTNGELAAMGLSLRGNLGLPSGTNYYTPMTMQTDVVAFTVGHEFSAFVKNDGSLWTTGKNDFGQLADGTSASQAVPMPHLWRDITVASARLSRGLYARSAGSVYRSGGSGSSRMLEVTQVATGGRGELAVTSSGTLWSLSDSGDAVIPQGTNVVRVAVGMGHALFVKSDGVLWGFGGNTYGQLGDGSTTRRDMPVEITGGVADVSATGDFSLVLKTDGTLMGSGRNQAGQLGIASLVDVPVPVPLATDVVSASAGFDFTLYVKSDGMLWGLGRNDQGQLGNGTTADTHVPVPIMSGVRRVWAGTSHALILKTDDSLWATGSNLYGQLGDGTNTSRSTPVLVAENVLWAEAGNNKSLIMRAVATPTVSLTPAHPAVVSGQSLTLQAHAIGEGALTYQWFRGASGDTSDPIADATGSALITPALTSASSFWVRVSNLAGATDSATAAVAIVGPTIQVQPSAQTVTAGGVLTLSVEAASDDPLTYQWYHDDDAIDGANGATLTLPSAQAFHAGNYKVDVSSGGHSLTSLPAAVTISAAAPSSARLLNLSTRALGMTGDDRLIPGFVIGGIGSKQLLIRGIGPTLGVLGVPNALADPQMTVKRGADTIATNDDWGTNANKAEIVATSKAVGAFSLSESSKDSVLLLDLGPGSYTVPTEGVAGGTGIALVELYDADPASPPATLLNISNRGFVGVGEAVMIPGIVVSNEGSRTFLVRAVGPSLARFNVAGLLADPKLSIYRRLPGNPPTEQLILGNDNWDGVAGSATTANVAAAVSAFRLEAGSKDAAFVVTLTPGVYTVQATGVGGATGVALVEVYLVP